MPTVKPATRSPYAHPKSVWTMSAISARGRGKLQTVSVYPAEDGKQTGEVVDNLGAVSESVGGQMIRGVWTYVSNRVLGQVLDPVNCRDDRYGLLWVVDDLFTDCLRFAGHG